MSILEKLTPAEAGLILDESKHRANVGRYMMVHVLLRGVYEIDIERKFSKKQDRSVTWLFLRRGPLFSKTTNSRNGIVERFRGAPALRERFETIAELYNSYFSGLTKENLSDTLKEVLPRYQSRELGFSSIKQDIESELEVVKSALDELYSTNKFAFIEKVKLIGGYVYLINDGEIISKIENLVKEMEHNFPPDSITALKNLSLIEKFYKSAIEPRLHHP